MYTHCLTSCHWWSWVPKTNPFLYTPPRFLLLWQKPGHCPGSAVVLGRSSVASWFLHLSKSSRWKCPYRTKTQGCKSSEIGTDTRKEALSVLRYKGRTISRMLGTKSPFVRREKEISTGDRSQKLVQDWEIVSVGQKSNGGRWVPGGNTWCFFKDWREVKGYNLSCMGEEEHLALPEQPLCKHGALWHPGAGTHMGPHWLCTFRTWAWATPLPDYSGSFSPLGCRDLSSPWSQRYQSSLTLCESRSKEEHAREPGRHCAFSKCNCLMSHVVCYMP